MKIRKPDEKIEIKKPQKSNAEKMQESIDSINKKIDKLFKVLDYRFTSK